MTDNRRRREAADKIEQLEAEVERLKSEPPLYHGKNLFDEDCGDTFPFAVGRWVTVSYARRLVGLRTITSKELEAAAHELCRVWGFQIAWTEMPDGYKSDLKRKASAIFQAAGLTIDESKEKQDEGY